jgi:excinuclease ABC subunit C
MNKRLLNIKGKIKKLTNSPGVYLFLKKEKVVYVGKAKKLKPRVTSYFNSQTQLPLSKVKMISEMDDFDFIVVSSEKEALLLEANLIKKYQPEYNILLKDDKSFFYLETNYEEVWPSISLVRQKDIKNKRKNKHFGPYTSGRDARKILQNIKKIFPICFAPGNKNKKPCFNYQISRCHGACVGLVSLSEYKQTFKQVENFLKGNIEEIISKLKKEMAKKSASKKFELAGKIRDQIVVLEKIKDRQKVVSLQTENADYVSLNVFEKYSKAVVNLLIVRHGKMINSLNIKIDLTKKVFLEPKQILQDFITQFYDESFFRGQTIYTTEDIDSFADLKIKKVERGERKKMIAISEQNAREFFSLEKKDYETQMDLSVMQKDLHLKKAPHRIECYDISNIQGNFATGSMVVSENGFLKKSEYRKFKIKKDGSPDDFAMMAEVLSRRFGLEKNQNKVKEKKDQNWKKPNLVIIDGGKGQLSKIHNLFEDNNIRNIELISLAKREEEIFFPTNKNSLILKKDSETLRFIQVMRDEAHRFAISFYRKRHGQATTTSWLDEVKGIGPATRKKLIRHFGSSLAVKTAEFEDIEKLIGKKAKLIKDK